MKLTDYKSICKQPHFRKITINKMDDEYILNIHTNTIKSYILSVKAIEDLKKSIIDYFYKRLVDIHTIEDVVGFLEKRNLKYHIEIEYPRVNRNNYKLSKLSYLINFGDVSVDIIEDVKFKSPKTYTYNFIIKKYNKYYFNSTDVSIKNNDIGKIVYINSRQ